MRVAARAERDEDRQQVLVGRVVALRLAREAAIGEKVGDPSYAMYLGDIFTVTANLAALPAISIPIGTVDGLPAGGQFIADRWGEATMVRAAAALERALQDGAR